MSGLKIWLGIPQKTYQFRVYDYIWNKLERESLETDKPIAEIIRESLLDRYIMDIARDIRQEALARHKELKAKRKAGLKEMANMTQGK